MMKLWACKLMMPHSNKHTGQAWPKGSRWMNFVELYTELKLKYDTDRLYALSGMAATISPDEIGQEADATTSTRVLIVMSLSRTKQSSSCMSSLFGFFLLHSAKG